MTTSTPVDSMSLQGKVALVTGGAMGIGRAFAESLLEQGAEVAICDRSRQEGENTLAELTTHFGNRCIFLHCDVTDDEQFEDCFKSAISKFHKLDIVLNNAGIVNENEDGWRKMVDINLVGVIKGTHLGFKYMSREQGGQGGTIVNTASLSSFFRIDTLPVYSATKAAVNQFSRSKGTDLYYKKSGVKVMSVNPGVTNTQMAASLTSTCVQKEDIIKKQVALLSIVPEQPASHVGQCLIEILKKGENGSIWIVDNNQPPVASPWTIKFEGPRPT